jgi:hypothetical protein
MLAVSYSSFRAAHGGHSPSFLRSFLLHSVITQPLTGNCLWLSARSVFQVLLEGRRCRILTDRKLLVATMSRTTPPWFARQQRKITYLAEIFSDFEHTPGTTSVIVDALSQLRPLRSGQLLVSLPAAPGLPAATKDSVAPQPPAFCSAPAFAALIHQLTFRQKQPLSGYVLTLPQCGLLLSFL